MLWAALGRLSIGSTAAGKAPAPAPRMRTLQEHAPAGVPDERPPAHRSALEFFVMVRIRAQLDDGRMAAMATAADHNQRP